MNSRNEKLVYAYLKDEVAPVSAYDILDGLRDEGIRAPLQVYRALTRLIEDGAAHRIESQNAFVACKQHECTENVASIFMLCKNCKKVTEIADNAISAAIDTLCLENNFKCEKRVIEISGACTACKG